MGVVHDSCCAQHKGVAVMEIGHSRLPLPKYEMGVTVHPRRVDCSCKQLF